MLKALFLKLKLKTVTNSADHEAMKQWMLKVEGDKAFNKDKELIEKAKNAINDTVNEKTANPVDLDAYWKLRKKYKQLFNDNNSDLVAPSANDVYIMDSLSLDEVEEMVDNSKKDLFTKYYRSIIEIYRSSRDGVIVRPTSGGLIRPTGGDPSRSNTPTNDFIDDHVDSTHNPFDDLGVD